MPNASPKPLSRRQAERQEGVFAKLQPLARQVDALARRRPLQAVPEDVRVAAEALLYEVLAFRTGRGRGELPEAAPHCAGLAAQLGEALGVLMAFEARHTSWDARLAIQVWRVEPPAMPVRRLQPRPGSRAALRIAAKAEAAAAAAARAAYMAEIRQKLVRRLEQEARP